MKFRKKIASLVIIAQTLLIALMGVSSARSADPIAVTGQASFTLLPTYASTTATYGATGGDGSYTYSLQSQPEQVSIDQASGLLTIAPGLALGSYSFKVVVTDGASATANKDLTITVAWNPIAVTGQASFTLLPTYASTTATYGATGGDGSYTYSLQSQPEQVSIDQASGLLTIAPGLALGSYSFKVVVTDGASATANKDLTITVAWNPIAVTGQASFTLLPTYASTTATYGATGGDGSYTYSLQSQPEQVSIDQASGLLTIAPGLALGSYSFKVVVTDGASATANKDLTITVAWNPIAVTGQASFTLLPTYASTTATYGATGGDGSYTYSLQSQPEQVSIDQASGLLTIAPGLALGSYSFKVVVTDGASATANKDLTITVAWNPIAVTGQASFTLLPTYASTTATYGATGGDGSYTYSLQSQPEQVSIDQASGLLTIAPGLALGSYSFKVVVTDGASATANKDLTITVAWNPIAVTGQASFTLLPTYASTTATYGATGGDGSYTYSLQSQPEQVSIDQASGLLTIAPGLALGSYSFKVVVTDGASATANKDLTITVAWNPIAVTGQASFTLLPTYASTTATYGATGGDGSYTYSLQSQPEQVSIDQASGLLTIAPGLALGSYSFKVVVTDGASATANKDLTITVAWNPIAVTGQASFTLLPTYASTTATYGATGGDGSYTYSLQSQPEQVSIDQASGLLTIAPGLALGSYSFKVVVTDGASATANKDLTITVAWNPIAVTGQASFTLLPTYASTTATYGATGGDGSYTYSLQSQPEQVSIDQASGLLTIAPGLALGSYSFKVVVTDGASATANKDLTITVAWNPIAVTGQASFTLLPTYASTTATYGATGGDGSYTYSLQSQPEQVSIDQASGLLTIAPGLALGSYSFKVVVTDGASATANKDLTITVAWNPIAVTGQASFTLLPTYASTTATYGATGGDGSYTYSLQSQPEQVSIDQASGLLTIAPGLALGSYSFFALIVQDSRGVQSGLGITIRVEGSGSPGGGSSGGSPSVVITAKDYIVSQGDVLPRFDFEASNDSSIELAPTCKAFGGVKELVATLVAGKYVIRCFGASLKSSGVITYVNGLLTITASNAAGSKELRSTLDAPAFYEIQGLKNESVDFLLPGEGSNDFRVKVVVPRGSVTTGFSISIRPWGSEKVDSNYPTFEFVVTSQNGEVLDVIDAPITISFVTTGDSSNFFSSRNGEIWAPITELTGKTLPSGLSEGVRKTEDDSTQLLTELSGVYGIKLTPSQVIIKIKNAKASWWVDETVQLESSTGEPSLRYQALIPTQCEVTSSGIVRALRQGVCVIQAFLPANDRFISSISNPITLLFATRSSSNSSNSSSTGSNSQSNSPVKVPAVVTIKTPAGWSRLGKLPDVFIKNSILKSAKPYVFQSSKVAQTAKLKIDSPTIFKLGGLQEGTVLGITLISPTGLGVPLATSRVGQNQTWNSMPILFKRKGTFSLLIRASSGFQARIFKVIIG